MKICILVPSDDHMQQAGVRIRYRRIESALAVFGDELSILPIARFERAEDFVHDVYIISKCYDARSLMAAHLVSSQGRLLGVDLFDDYFSQADDSRFVRMRVWLDSLLRLTDFVLCSTPPMQAVARELAPDQPIHVLNDPYETFDPDELGGALVQKLDQLHATGVLRIGWFGVGDNPHFSVGLADLVAFGGELSRLRANGLEVRLDILTNARAMTAQALAMLKRLAVPYEIEEWTEAREAALLDRCAAVFLPVNAQGFSLVKSLNRAVTALSAGVQVLSAGFPLYEALAPLIYRDPIKLLLDLKERRLLLRQDTLPLLAQLMGAVASPAEEAGRLSAFLSNLSGPTPAQPSPPIALVHGLESSGNAHKFVQKIGGLSVASPVAKQKLNYDVRFVWRQDATGLEVLISEKKRQLLAPKFAAQLIPNGKILETQYSRLDLSSIAASRCDTVLGRLQNPAGFSVSHHDVISSVSRTMQTLFPGVICVLSEDTKLPWRIPKIARRVSPTDSH